jgi:CHAD domain-containing protein
MARKKWYITGIKINNSYFTEGKRVLRQRLSMILDNINKYLTTHDIEDLHQLRISIRRFRYPFEIFINFFPKKLFMDFYNKINQLQDLTGYGRDADVMMIKLNKYMGDKKKTLPYELFEDLKTLRDDYYFKVDGEVKKFLDDALLAEVKELIDFNKFVRHK